MNKVIVVVILYIVGLRRRCKSLFIIAEQKGANLAIRTVNFCEFICIYLTGIAHADIVSRS